MNLSLNCGDDPCAVLKNREILRAALPADPQWLKQEHGVTVFSHPCTKSDAVVRGPGEPVSPVGVPSADAQVTSRPGQICAVLTADCLPVLFCNKTGTRVAAAHAGWRGLAAGVLENTVQAMGDPAGELLAWLGPAIGADAYEVGDDVMSAFLNQDENAAGCFARHGDRWLFDLFAMARQRLERAGVEHVSGGTYCTYRESERFFSYRRDGVTGRMASLVWLQA